MRTLAPLLAATTLAVLLAGCSSSTTGGVAHDHIELQDDAFAPTSKSVNAGTTVGWVNEGAHQHTVTIHSNSGGAPLKDAVVAPGQETEHTFTEKGSYHIVCRFHEGNGMQMTVTVK